MTLSLFDSNGFREVFRLIDRAAVGFCDVICKELQRHDLRRDDEQVVHARYEDHIVRLDARTDNVRAASLTRDWLSAHPDDSNIVFIATNDDRGYAAVSQIQALERTADCAVVSFNGDPAAREDLKKQADDASYESPWVASIAFNPSQYGASIVEFAKQIFAGSTEKTYNAVVTPLTKDTIHDYLKEIGEE